jgi:hypothetical protein
MPKSPLRASIEPHPSASWCNSTICAVVPLEHFPFSLNRRSALSLCGYNMRDWPPQSCWQHHFAGAQAAIPSSCNP